MFLKSLSGLRLHSLFLLLVLTLPLSSCGTNPLNLLTGGGPNVAANTQIGKTNNQTVGVNNTQAPTVSLRPKARVDNIDQSSNSTTNNELPVWVWVIGILLLIVGWVTDTPATIIKNFRKK